jgi:AcrR family transcriptional regulator
METAKKSKTKTPLTEDRIREVYRTYVLTEGKSPATVFAFCQSLDIKEEEFYAHFGSFEALEKSIWNTYIRSVIERLHVDESYGGFTAREKILSFYFTLAEVLKADRSFVLHKLQHWKNPAQMPVFLKGFKVSFDEWIKGVITSGIQSGEVAKRPLIDQRYDSLFWLHLMFILQFWSHDESANFEKTDAAIEKSVNLAFDLIGKGILDNALDFGKFLYQSSKN